MYFSAMPATEELGKYHTLMPDRKYNMSLSCLLEEQNNLQLLLLNVELRDSVPR